MSPGSGVSAWYQGTTKVGRSREGAGGQGGSRRRGAWGLGRRSGGSRRGTHRTHDTHDALPQQPRVDVIGALAATLGERDRKTERTSSPETPTPSLGQVPAAAVPSAPPRWV